MIYTSRFFWLISLKVIVVFFSNQINRSNSDYASYNFSHMEGHFLKF